MASSQGKQALEVHWGLERRHSGRARGYSRKQAPVHSLESLLQEPLATPEQQQMGNTIRFVRKRNKEYVIFLSEALFVER